MEEKVLESVRRVEGLRELAELRFLGGEAFSLVEGER